LLLSLPERRAPASSGERAARRVHRRPTLLPVRRELTHRRAAPDRDGVCCLHVAVRFYQFDEKTIEKCCANEGVFRQKPPPLPTNKFQRKVHYTRLHARAHTHARAFNGPLSGTTRVSRYQKGKPIWILLKQETVSGSGISWALCRSAPCSRQITIPAPHHSVFYRPDALPAAQPTASKH